MLDYLCKEKNIPVSFEVYLEGYASFIVSSNLLSTQHPESDFSKTTLILSLSTENHFINFTCSWLKSQSLYVAFKALYNLVAIDFATSFHIVLYLTHSDPGTLAFYLMVTITKSFPFQSICTFASSFRTSIALHTSTCNSSFTS